jgi:ubiquinone/menaquinone biosynthesis C-methylase UbiE
VDATSTHYEDVRTAADYRARFSKSWTRRLSNRLELRMLRRALARLGGCEAILDVPCGAGRLTTTLQSRASDVCSVDAARAMLDEARGLARRRREAAAGGPCGVPTRFVRASAFRLPFADRAFDVSVCWRLLQHFADPAERARLLCELARVTRRAIVLSFSDAGTGRARRLARRPRAKPGRVAIGRDELAAEIAACGLAPERFYRLFGPLSVVGAVLIRVGRPGAA